MNQMVVGIIPTTLKLLLNYLRSRSAYRELRIKFVLFWLNERSTNVNSSAVVKRVEHISIIVSVNI